MCDATMCTVYFKEQLLILSNIINSHKARQRLHGVNINFIYIVFRITWGTRVQTAFIKCNLISNHLNDLLAFRIDSFRFVSLCASFGICIYQNLLSNRAVISIYASVLANISDFQTQWTINQQPNIYLLKKSKLNSTLY